MGSNKVIKKNMIFLDVDYSDKKKIINFIIEKAFQNGLISQKDHLEQSVLNRELEVPTNVGYKIAMPHGKSDTVLEPFISFLRTKKKFRWSRKNDENVQLIFLIAVPEENKDNMHLKFISETSKKLLDDDFRNILSEEENKRKIIKLLSTIKID